MNRILPALALCLGYLVWLPSGAVNAGDLSVSEFMALNETGLRDEDGDHSDWVELFNSGTAAVELNGWALTDDRTQLQKWLFPNQTLGAGQYLVVFASAKDRRMADKQLHANFRLATEGGYLALVKPGGTTIAQEFAPYPPQRADVSYGMSQTEKRTPFITESSSTRIMVPTNSNLSPIWTGGSEPFDDSSWIIAKNAAGYVTSIPGFSVQNIKSAAAVEDLGAAEEVIQTSTLQAGIDTENSPMIDYLGTSAPGHHPDDRPFPGTTAGQMVEDFVVLALGKVSLPQAGDWTFGVMSDDGFGLDLTRGTEVFHMEYPAPRGPSDSLETFTLAEAGDYDLRLVFYQRGGGAGLELFAAQGRFDAWNGADFRRVGDTAQGGLAVRSQPVSGGTGLGLEDLIQTDLKDILLNRNPGLYVRIPFVPDLSKLAALYLNVRYNDGFIAYLNGTRIAQRNVPAPVPYNSTALFTRPVELASTPENIDISTFGSLLRSGTNILALHGLNDRIDSPDFFLSASLESVAGSLGKGLYFANATPGKANSAGVEGFVDEPLFSVDRGFYSQPIEVALHCATEGATIRFTTNGSPPNATNGAVYTVPIRIAGTTVVRAAASRPGFQSSAVGTQSYLFLDDIILQDAAATRAAGFPTSWTGTAPDYGLDKRVIGQNGTDAFGGRYARTIKDDLQAVPTLSIVTDINAMFGTQGIYSHPTSCGDLWEKPVSVELIYPDARPGFQIDAGALIQGGAFRDFGLTKKKSFRLAFRQKYGAAKLHYPFFGTGAGDRFDSIILRATNNDGWQWDAAGGIALYMRDAYALASARDMGMVASHASYAHLYINGIYWGLYNPVERPDASFSASYFGGQKEDWDGINYDSAPDGTYDAWNRMLAICRSGLANNINYQKVQGNNPDGTRNPQFEDLLDVDNLIDYMILNCYVGNNDWPHRNYWVGRNRNNGDGFKFYPWDTEWSIGLQSDLNTDKTGVNNAVAEPYGLLRANADFRMRFADHVYRHFFNGGAFYVDPAHPAWDPTHPEWNRPAARFLAWANQVDRAVVPESARWGDQHGVLYTRDAHWQPQRDSLLANYFPSRSARVLAQFRQAGLFPAIDPPVMNQRGGQVQPGFAVTLTASKGTILYTTDGSDPRAATVVEEVSRTTVVGYEAPKKALIPSAANGGATLGAQWRGGSEPFDDSGWQSGTGGVGYDRDTTYVPFFKLDVKTAMDNKNCSAFIRVPFVFDGLNRERLNFMILRMRYDDGFVAFLNGVQIAAANAPTALAWNSVAPQQNSDSAAVNFEEFKADDLLSALRVGTNILAIQGLNLALSSTDFLIGCELVIGERKTSSGTTGAQPYTVPLVLTDLTRLKTRVLSGSEWSALNEATFVVGAPALAITELDYHPLPPSETERAAGITNADDFEFIELLGKGTGTFDLQGVRFTGGIQFDFSSSATTRLAAGRYLLVVKNRAAFERRYGAGWPVAGEFAARLSNGGDRITLVDAVNQTILDFSYGTQKPWPAAADGAGSSLEVIDLAGDLNSPENWRASVVPGGSPGQANPIASLRLEGVTSVDGKLQFRFQGEAGVGYTVYQRASLNSGVWDVFERGEPLVQAGPVEVTVDSQANSGARFYIISIP